MRWPPRDTPEMGHPGAGGVRSDTNYIRYPQVGGYYYTLSLVS